TTVGGAIGGLISAGACWAAPYYIKALFAIIAPQLSIGSLTLEGGTLITAGAAAGGGLIGCVGGCVGQCCCTKEDKTVRNLRSIQDELEKIRGMGMNPAEKAEIWRQTMIFVSAVEQQASHTVRMGRGST